MVQRNEQVNRRAGWDGTQTGRAKKGGARGRQEFKFRMNADTVAYRWLARATGGAALVIYYESEMGSAARTGGVSIKREETEYA